MAQIVTHHGYRFGLDTADWGSNSASGEKARAKMQNQARYYGSNTVIKQRNGERWERVD